MSDSLWYSLEIAARDKPDHSAIIFDGRSTTYAELLRHARAAANGLWALDVRPGDRIAFLAANRPEYLTLMFAAARIGAALVPINTRYGSTDLEGALHRCGAAVLFYARGFRKQNFETLLAPVLQRIEPGEDLGLESLPELRRAICLDDGPSAKSETFSELLRRGATLPEVQIDARAQSEAVGIMLFTSGSSGVPKPVMLGQGQLVRNARRMRDRQKIGGDDRILSFLPYFHVFGGVLTVLVPLLSQATVVMMEAFESIRSLELVEKYRCTVVYGVATTYCAWFNEPDLARYDLSSIRTGICSAGLPTMSATARRVRAEFAPMHSLFGMTETTGIASLTRVDDDETHATGSAGQTLPDAEIIIVDPETGRPLSAGEQGEVRVRGDMVTRGYFRMPEQTRHAIDEQGWLHTGDRGYLDEAGYLHVSGRLDDRLRCGGENIDPREVEHFIQTHPAVEACQIVGVPDRRLLEIPVAFIVPHASASVDEEEIQAYCRGRIANFKCPRRVFVVEEFPGWMHKVQRYKLRADAMQRMGLTEDPAI